MTRLKTMILASMLLGAAAAWGQETNSAAPMDDACAKHMGDHKAMMEKNATAWREIRASVDAAKQAKGDQKVAALETALDRLVAFHESMMAGPGGPMPGMPMGDMACCGGAAAKKQANMACCADRKVMADCCGPDAKAMKGDCPMTKKGI